MAQKFLFPLIILGCTLVFVLPLLLWQGHTANMGSLEPVYLSLAERVAKEGPWGWYPNWYLGFPFRFAGPPATWWILGALNRLTGSDMLLLYRTMMFSALLVFPVSFYFLALKVFGQQKREFKWKKWLSYNLSAVLALVSTLALVALPSIGYLFPQAFRLGGEFGFAPLWMQQDLPRAAGLSLLPICLVFYWRLFEKSTPKRFTTATLCTSVLFLTDGVTALSLLIGTGALLVLEGKEKILRNFTLGAGALIAPLLLDAFYYTPANLKILAFSPTVSGVGLIYFVKTLMQAVLGLGPAIAAILWLKVFKKGRQLNFILLWTLPFLSLVLIYFASNPAFLTEYIRFIPELEMGIALLFGLAHQKYFPKFRTVRGIGRKLSVALALTLIAGLLTLSLPGRWEIFATHPQIEKSVEFQTAKWLEQNMGEEVFGGVKPFETSLEGKPVMRVLLSGSTAFWLNKFAPDVFQLRGGLDHASSNMNWRRGVFEIRNDKDLEHTMLWAKVLRIQYLVVHERYSKEFYHDFLYTQKFDVCDTVRTNGDFSKYGCALFFGNGAGDRIYRIDSWPAYVAPKNGLSQLTTDKLNFEKERDLKKYLSWLISGKMAGIKMNDNGLLLNTNTSPEWVINVALSYHPGWQAKDQNGTNLKTGKDPLGNLVIYPNVVGEQTIKLSYYETWDLWAGILISLAGFISLGFVPKLIPRLVGYIERGWTED